MKAIFSTLGLLLLLTLPPLSAQTPPGKPLASVATEWRGVHFDIAEILRLDGERILVAVRVRGDATAKNPTRISGADRSSPENPGDIESFTLAEATLTDEGSGQSFTAESGVPGSPFWGEPSIIATVRPNTWFQLAVCFKVPRPPQATPGGKPVEQKVTFHLPRAKGPIKGVTLPPPGESSKGKTP